MNLESINKVYTVPNIKLKPKLGHTSDEVQNRLFARRVKILKYIREHGKVKVSDISKDLDVIKQTVTNDIETLVNAHAVEKRCSRTKAMTVEYCIRYDGIYCVL